MIGEDAMNAIYAGGCHSHWYYNMDTKDSYPHLRFVRLQDGY